MFALTKAAALLFALFLLSFLFNAAGSPPVGDSVIYVTQDANYNVTGLWDEGGGVLAQYTYEPYGQCVAAEHFTDPPVLNRLGHQGLFFENFDDPAAGLTATTAAPGAVTTGVYHNRNRHYSPALGRFLQRDPNETGQPVIKDLAAFGQPPCNCPNNIDIMEAYQDGANLFEYVGSSPVNYSDPGGLDWLDDEGISTDSQTYGLATAQISIASGQLFSLANLGTAFATNFLAFTGGAGKSALDQISDCLKSGDPSATLNSIAETAVKLGPMLFAPLPKTLLYFGNDKALAKATGSSGSLFTRLSFGGARLGLISDKSLTQLKFAGRAVSTVATRVTALHGLYLAGLEAYCGVKHGILGY